MPKRSNPWSAHLVLISLALALTGSISMVTRSHATECHNDVWEHGEFCGHDALHDSGSTEMNHDCYMDNMDMVLFQKELDMGASGPNLSADLDGDGFVGLGDLELLAGSFVFGDYIFDCTPGGMREDTCGGALAISFGTDPSSISSTAILAPGIHMAYVVIDEGVDVSTIEFTIETSPNIQIIGLSASMPWSATGLGCDLGPGEHYQMYSRAAPLASRPEDVVDVLFLLNDESPAWFQLIPAPSCAQARVRWAEEAHDRSIEFKVVLNAGINGPAPVALFDCDKAPSMPEALAVAYYTMGGNELSWLPNLELDLLSYHVYRGNNPDFDTSAATLVTVTDEPSWLDPAPTNPVPYYKVSAVDLADNESEAAVPGTVTVVGDASLPVRSPILQNVPNPFNPMTTIQFDVPAPGGHVRLEIFDVGGHCVRTILDKALPGGRHSEVWDGRDEQGRPVVSGVYHSKLTAAGYSSARKMTLVR